MIDRDIRLTTGKTDCRRRGETETTQRGMARYLQCRRDKGRCGAEVETRLMKKRKREGNNVFKMTRNEDTDIKHIESLVHGQENIYRYVICGYI